MEHLSVRSSLRFLHGCDNLWVALILLGCIVCYTPQELGVMKGVTVMKVAHPKQAYIRAGTVAWMEYSPTN